MIMRLLSGKAVLEVHPPAWLDPRMGEPVEQAAAAVRALWAASPFVTAVKVSHNDPAIAVEVSIPEDGSLDLEALQQELVERVRRSRRPRGDR